MKFLICLIWMLGTLATTAAENELYDFSWLDKGKQVYVLQNRVYEKAKSLYIGGDFIAQLNETFTDGMGFRARGGYFFRENIGVEFTYALLSNSENTAAKAIKEQGTVPFYRQVSNYMAASVVYAPFYGKFNAFDQIFYMDLMFSLGAARLQTEDNRGEFLVSPDSTLQVEDHIGVTWGLIMRFYITQKIAARFGFSGLHYNANYFLGVRGPQAAQREESQRFDYFELALGVDWTF